MKQIKISRSRHEYPGWVAGHIRKKGSNYIGYAEDEATIIRISPDYFQVADALIVYAETLETKDD